LIVDQSLLCEFLINAYKQEMFLVEAGVDIELIGVLPVEEHRLRALSVVCPDGEWTRLWVGTGMSGVRMGLNDISAIWNGWPWCGKATPNEF
jgi:hypothetical protein